MTRTGEPGERFTYSNTNFTLIGMIIEKVTGPSASGEHAQQVMGADLRARMAVAMGVPGR
ncbi:serine hydrolase [Streptosporangium sp. G11]|uniref:serine hydrolase n=1 Tax=Streptosporangium sp. G11 TaxID=3436926 RepID=UPI003EBEB1C3